jgi:hypothetical protein
MLTFVVAVDGKENSNCPISPQRFVSIATFSSSSFRLLYDCYKRCYHQAILHNGYDKALHLDQAHTKLFRDDVCGALL